jgi:cell wall assembly regulator SMI1
VSVEVSVVADLWSRWERWLTVHASDLLAELRPPATPEAVSAAEERLGLSLPADFRASLAVHDGAEEVNGLIGDWDLMELDNVVHQARLMRQMVADNLFGDACGDPHDAIDSTWWNPAWVPFVSSGSGHFYCIDLAPAPGGTVGQIIVFFHDDGQRLLVADSYRQWLAAVVSDLERGVYRYEDESWNHHAFLKSSREGGDTYG